MTLAVFCCGEQVCLAKVETFHSESSYLMKKSESIKDAQDIAFKDAIRMMSEEASIVIEGLSEANDNKLLIALKHSRLQF